MGNLGTPTSTLELMLRIDRDRKRTYLIWGSLALLTAAALAVGLQLAGAPGPGTHGAAGGGTTERAESTRAGETQDAQDVVDPAANPAPAVPEPGKPEEKGRAAVPVSIIPTIKGEISSYITATANLVSENEVKVLAESEGRVAELRVEEGDRVGGREVLASLVKEDAEIDLRKAELRAENARLAYERGGRLLAEKLKSPEEYDRLTMEKEVSEQELAEARWKLEKRTIRAPFGGRVTERTIRLGQHVKPGETLFTVSDFDPLVARIYLPEKDMVGLAEGRPVRIALQAGENVSFKGRIRQIAPVVDTATGTVKVTVEAVEPPAGVRPGAFVSIGIVRETRPAAVLLPREAVIRELQEAYVFVARGQVAERRRVTLGFEEGGRVEILTGVAPGEQVIVAGQGGLKDGAPIKIVPATSALDLEPPADLPRRG